MGNREYYQRRAEAERATAMAARDVAVIRAHMDLAREYEWRAATEPYPESVSQPLNLFLSAER